MSKGKLGITLSAVAALAFVLAFFGFAEVLVLVVGYALIVEGDNWLTKQTLQALFLVIAYKAASTILGWIFGGMIGFFGLFNLVPVVGAIASLQTGCGALLSVAMLILCILATLKVVKNQDANLPFVGGLADKSLGVITPKAAPVQPQAQHYTAPVAPTPVAPVTEPAPQVASDSWVCGRGTANTGKFCVKCGAKNPNL